MVDLMTALGPVPFILGCGGMSDDDPEAAFAVLDAYFDSGGRVVDTARVYGTSEEVLGKWITSRGVRDDLVIVSKAAHPDLTTWQGRITAEDVRNDLLRSAEALAVESIDLVLLHRDDPGLTVGEIAAVLDGAESLGVAASFGVSNWRVDRVAQLQAVRPIMAISNHFGYVGLQRPSYPGVVEVDAELIQFAERDRIPVLAWGSLSSGFLAGAPTASQVYDSELNRGRRSLLLQVAGQQDVDADALLVRWLVTRSPMLVPIASSSRPGRVRDICRFATDSDLDGAVAALDAALRHTYPFDASSR